MNILDGRKTARSFEAKIRAEVTALKEKHGREPKLVVVLVGDNPASMAYVKSKEKASKRVGINGVTMRFPSTITEAELLGTVLKLNEDETVDGMIVQLPLPTHINSDNILNHIAPHKDVDGLSFINAGKLANRQYGLLPATPKGVMMLLDHYKVQYEGKDAVVVGASNLVGSPMAKLLLHRGATITVCHSKTKDLASHTKRADILVVATGVVNLIRGEMVKKGAIVVDVGINRVDGKIVGDVNYDEVKEKAALITPVPGGVGPMTINALMFNVLEAFKNRHQ